MIVCAAPAAKSRRASASTAWGVVRSPMPTSTAPLPITRTSPPSIVADPWSSSTPPYQRSKPASWKSGWKRYTASRWAVSRRRAGMRHRVHRHAAVDPAGRVAGEEVVRQRREHEAPRPEDLGPQAARRAGRQLGARDAADEMGGDGRRIGLVEERPDGSREVAPEVSLGDDAIEEPRAGGVALHRLGEELRHVEHLHAMVRERVGEGVVLLAGPLDPQHVVEQQVGAVGRGQATELEVGAVQQHTAQDAHLGVDVERGHAVDGGPARPRSIGPLVLPPASDRLYSRAPRRRTLVLVAPVRPDRRP